MNFRRGRGREHPEINLIPFIDVLLVIVIFLMVTTTYSKFTELHITLPTADADKSQQTAQDINVTVDVSGNYTINKVPLAFHDVAGFASALKRAASALNKDAKTAARLSSPVIVIDADQFAMHQMVINVMEAARLAGFEKLTFAARTAVSTK